MKRRLRRGMSVVLISSENISVNGNIYVYREERKKGRKENERKSVAHHSLYIFSCVVMGEKVCTRIVMCENMYQ